MCNYGSSSVKLTSQKEFSNLQPVLSRYYSTKVKAQKEASIKCKNIKSGIGGSKLSTRVFISWFGQPQRHTYIHVVEALTKSIAFRQSSHSRGHRVTMVTLIPISTKELLHKGWGSPCALHKIVHAAHTKSAMRSSHDSTITFSKHFSLQRLDLSIESK